MEKPTESLQPFHYVYILESLAAADKYYVGSTQNLCERLACHNHGSVPHSAKYRPWQIKTAIAFIDRRRAVAFENYLKTASGRAFTKKRL
jgi:predicted GIY-YIG superfamily endonuclease